MKNNNIISINRLKQQSGCHKKLEIILRDSLDNIEDYSFQMFFDCDIDSILDFEITPYYLPLQNNELKVSA